MRRLVATVLAVGLWGSAAPAQAGRALQPPRAGPLPAWSLSGPVRDRVVTRPATRAARARAAVVARTAAETYRTPDGHPVEVEVSRSYPRDPRAVQAFVDFLGSRLHGREMGRLRLLIATPREVGSLCGERAVACYLATTQVMIVPGEQPSGQPPLELVVTHEYGHHVARHRRNDPWPAVAWGPKRWATHEGICRGVRDGRYFPGDQERRYSRNPGEAWAEAYALFHYREAPWQFTRTLRPDEGAFAAVQQDVLSPWRFPRPVVHRGSFPAGGRRARTFPIPTTLDGEVRLALRGPRGAQLDLQVLRGGQPVARTRARGSRDRIRGARCGGRRPLAVRVLRRSGAGRFRVVVVSPG